MSLKKPPIVEMWIEFKFDPNPSGMVGPAVSFLQEYADQYPELEVAHADTLEFRQMPRKKLPEVTNRNVTVDHFRAHDAEGSRWIHLTRTQLVCSFLRLGESYPGFVALCEEATAKFARFMEVCQPVKLLYIAIHYVDVIEVPVPPGGVIQLGDYFTLGLDVPAEPFGNQLSYLLRTAVRPPDTPGDLEIQLQLDSFSADPKGFRFRMDWHKVCPYDSEAASATIPVVLRRAHESVMKCFRAAFTDRTWNLFEPTE